MADPQPARHPHNCNEVRPATVELCPVAVRITAWHRAGRPGRKFATADVVVAVAGHEVELRGVVVLRRPLGLVAVMPRQMQDGCSRAAIRLPAAWSVAVTQAIQAAAEA